MAAAAVISAATAAPSLASVRQFWVAAEPVTWNVVPNERNAIEGERFTREQTVFRTVVYRQFTRDFATELPKEPGNPGTMIVGGGGAAAEGGGETPGR